MKKLVLMFVAVAAISFASCGNNTAKQEATEEDAAMIDTLSEDSVEAEATENEEATEATSEEATPEETTEGETEGESEGESEE